MKILLIRLSSAGDIILVSPVIRFIKYNIPGCRVDLLVKEQFEKAAHLIGADRVFKLKKTLFFIEEFVNLSEIIKQINHERYDIIIDLHSNFRTFFILLFSVSKIKEVIKKDIIKRRLMVCFKWFFGKYKTIEEKYLETAGKSLAGAGIKRIKSIPEKKTIKRRIKKIVVHVGAKWKLKRWPYFYELIKKLSELKGLKIFITGIKEEIEKNDKILYIKSNNVVNVIGKTTFDRLAFLIKNSDLFIGNDTAAAHLARFYNILSVVMMGPTVAEFGFISRKNFFIIEKKMSCRPCNLHGGNICPVGTFECMSGIKSDFVFSFIKKILKDKNV